MSDTKRILFETPEDDEMWLEGGCCGKGISVATYQPPPTLEEMSKVILGNHINPMSPPLHSPYNPNLRIISRDRSRKSDWETGSLLPSNTILPEFLA